MANSRCRAVRRFGNRNTGETNARGSQTKPGGEGGEKKKKIRDQLEAIKRTQQLVIGQTRAGRGPRKCVGGAKKDVVWAPKKMGMLRKRQSAVSRRETRTTRGLRAGYHEFRKFAEL